MKIRKKTKYYLVLVVKFMLKIAVSAAVKEIVKLICEAVVYRRRNGAQLRVQI
jgi:hypothetical protein